MSEFNEHEKDDDLQSRMDARVESGRANWRKIDDMPDAHPPLQITEKDVRCIFIDGEGTKWRLWSFDTHRTYEIYATAVRPVKPTPGELIPVDCPGWQANFNQFGSRYGYKDDSPYSLKTIIKQGDNT